MTNLINLLVTMNGLQGASFVGVQNYFVDANRPSSKALTSGYKNININVNVNRDTLKNKDRATLLNLNRNSFFTANIQGQFDRATFDKAVDSLIDQTTKVGQKLSNGKIKTTKTATQQAHDDVYTHIGKGIKVHKNTNDVYLLGVFQSSTAPSNGQAMPTYKSSNKRAQTQVQDILKRVLNLKSFQYRSMLIKHATLINARKTTFNGSDLIIGLD